MKQSDYEKYNYAISRTDKEKIEIIKTIEDDIYIVEILKSVKDENLKIENANNIHNERYKYELFLSIIDEAKKTESITQLNNEEYKYNIAMTLKNNELLMRAIDKINDKKYKAILTTRINNDEFKLQIINSLNDETLIVEIAATLSNDIQKEKIIKLLKQEQNKVMFICNLKNDQNKIEMLKTISNCQSITNILLTLSDELKIKYLNILTEEQNKYDVIATIKDEKIKTEMIKNLKDQNLIAKLVITLSDDRNKLSLMTVLQENQKLEIIKTVKKENLIYESLKYFENENYKIYIVQLLDSDDLKLKFIKENIDIIKNKNLIIDIIKTLKDISKAKNFIKIIYQTNNDIVIEFISHLNTPDIIKDNIEIIIDYSTKKIGLKKDNLLDMVEIFGYDIINCIYNQNIKEIINKTTKEEKQEIKKLITTENKEQEFTLEKIYSIAESFLQRKFELTKTKNRNILSTIYKNIENKDIEKLKTNIEEIISLKEMEKILIFKKPCTIKQLQDLLLTACINIINNEQKESSKEFINYVVNYYIREQRNIYVQKELKYNTKNVITLSKKPNKEKQINKIIETKSEIEIIDLLRKIEGLELQELNLLNDTELLTQCIRFKKHPNKTPIKQLGILNKLLSKLYYQKLTNNLYMGEDIMDNSIGKLNIDYYGFLSHVDCQQLKKILKDQKLKKQVEKIFKKYQVLYWKEIFDPIIKDLGLEFNNKVLSTIINSQEKVILKIKDILLEKEKHKIEQKITNVDLLTILNIFSKDSIRYRLLFGNSDYSYIVNDPQPDRSSLDSQERLNKAQYYYKKIYNREYITIPPLKEERIINEKKYKIIVGDLSNTINMTYGERTGACMRIGGTGESLLEFCLTNENGFHIRFQDETGNMISRVSGFRNGNTIFLNQLRYSLLDEFNDNEVIKMVKTFAKIIEEKTSTSKMPIENVLISPDYAMKPKEFDTVPIGITNIKEGYNYFYTDIGTNAIPLIPLKPIILTPINPKYEPLRAEEQKIYDNKEATEKINHILLVEGMLTNGIDKVELINDAKIAIVGEDWYIYIDSNGKIHQKIIEGINKNREKKANEEIEKYQEFTKILEVKHAK
ncbi:MAG: hypothetical protein J6B64_01880 [Bacilli bacterium]|nr:hypothetical protein [Bacilli bacterium]MBP3921305.1 hypothetical protein [Bacilli bacterium]